MIIRLSCKVKKLRKRNSLTQEDLAKKLGISRQALISVESGKSLPSLPLALQMSQIFDRSIEDIFCSLINNENTEVNMPRGLSPWRPLGLTRFFDNDWSDEDFFPDVRIPSSIKIPAVDVYEKGDNVIVEAHVPGLKVEDVNVEVAEDHLAISGERKDIKEEKEKNFYRKETSYGSFSRVVPLPVKINPEKTQATSEDGVLKITLPKAEVKKRKQIKVSIKKK